MFCVLVFAATAHLPTSLLNMEAVLVAGTFAASKLFLWIMHPKLVTTSAEVL
jgi:hypothetical protein